MYTEETSFTLTHTQLNPHFLLSRYQPTEVSLCCALFLLSEDILFARQLFNSKDDILKYLYKVQSVKNPLKITDTFREAFLYCDQVFNSKDDFRKYLYKNSVR
jgi:hypothetical protein